MTEATPRPTPASLATALTTTLAEEENALLHLRDTFARQLDALRRNDRAALELALLETNEVTAALDRLRQNRERQMRLLGRVLFLTSGRSDLDALADAVAPHDASAAVALSSARQAIRRRAGEVRTVSSEVEFALQFAIRIGRDLLMTLQNHDGATTGRTYTAAGQTAPATASRSLVNHVG